MATISKRNIRQSVFEAQKYLNFISKYIPNIPTITPDGIFGEKTENAVKAFQKLYLLPVTGEIDYNTWTLLYEVYTDIKEDIYPPEPIFVFPVEIVSMKLGDNFSEIIILQAVLDKISSRYENVPPIKITGLYDEDTENNVKFLQNIFGLEETGEVNRKTWNKLSKMYSVFTYNDWFDKPFIEC